MYHRKLRENPVLREIMVSCVYMWVFSFAGDDCSTFIINVCVFFFLYFFVKHFDLPLMVVQSSM